MYCDDDTVTRDKLKQVLKSRGGGMTHHFDTTHMYAGGVVLDTTSHETALRDFMFGAASAAESVTQP